MSSRRYPMAVIVLLALLSLSIVQLVVAQSSSIDNVVVTIPVCEGNSGRLAVTVTLDSSVDRYITVIPSGLSNNIGLLGAGTHTVEYQYIPPDNTLPGSILTASVLLGTNVELGDIDTETFSFNCTTGEKVTGQTAPFANYDSAYTLYATPVTINVAQNDIDADGNLNPASTTAVSNPASGTLTNNGNGVFVYTPNDGFSGLDTFNYQICDTTNLCGIGEVRLEVAPANRPPVANDDFLTTEQEIAIGFSVIDNDTDPDEFNTPSFIPSRVTLTTNPANGTLTNQGIGLYLYTPNAGFTGTDSFIYEVCDNGNLCDSASVTIEVKLPTFTPLPTAFPPFANDDYVGMFENTSINFNVTENDSAPQSQLDLASVNVVSGTTHGILTHNGSGSFTYTPELEFYGSDSFTYSICSINTLCDSAIVSINVERVIHPPIANDDYFTTQENVALTFNVLENDSDPDGDLDPSTVAVLANPAYGQLAINADRSYIYTPITGFAGIETIPYQVCDIFGLCDQAVITIEVLGSNHPPTPKNDAVTTYASTAVVIDVVSNDTDPDGNLNPASIRIVFGTRYGDLYNLGNGRFTYTPIDEFTGYTDFTYEICDVLGLCAQALVEIQVLAAPVTPSPTPTVTSTFTPTPTATLTPTIPPRPRYFEGCTADYWKQNRNSSSWSATGFSPNQTLESIFNVPDALGLDNVTLSQALNLSGGSGSVGASRLLLRAGVTALLNASHPSINYPLSTAQVITGVNTGLATNTRNTRLLFTLVLEAANYLGCPLN